MSNFSVTLNPDELIGRKPEKFMGPAEQVNRPALAGPAPTTPGANRAPAMAVSGASLAAGAATGKAYGIGNKLGAAASRVAPIAGKVVGGTAVTAPLTGFGDYKINDEVDSSAAGTLGNLSRGEFGMAGRGLQKGALEAGLDSVSGLAKTGDFVAGLGGFKPGLADSFNKMVRNDLGAMVSTPKLASEIQAEQQLAAQAAQNASSEAIATPPVQGGGQPAGLAGEAFGDFAGVRKVVGPNGVPMYTNATSNEADQRFLNQARPGSISGIGGGPEVLAAEQRAVDLAGQIGRMRAGLRDRGDINAYANQAAAQPGGISSDLQARLRGMLASGRRLSGTAWNAINAAAQNETAARGQDLDLAGRQQAARAAGLTAAQKQAQDDREFGLKERQFALDERRVGLQGAEAGAKRDSEAFSQQQAAQKSITDRFAAQFRTPEGKVDDARVAKFTTGVQTFLGNKQAELTSKVQAGTATKAEIKALENIQRRGVAALDEEDLTNIEMNLKRGERAQETAGLTGGSFVQSNDPNAYGVKGRKTNLFGSDTIELNNGTTVREADLQYTEPGNVLLPNILKTRTDEYGLKGKK